MKVLVTGCAGFIGMHVAERLLKRGDEVLGLDTLNDYYDVGLKVSRLHRLDNYPKFKLEDRFVSRCDAIVHLAAQAGVRYSLTNPEAYMPNVTNFLTVLESCRTRGMPLVYASSSSVYGDGKGPMSLYAATKKANEDMAYSYNHLFDVKATGLRFFTVYGPWGRPDMVMYKWTKAIMEGQPVELYNDGNMWRDFTYIDSAVDAVVDALDKGENGIQDVGSGKPVKLTELLVLLERAIGKKAKKTMLPMQPGDVPSTRCGSPVECIPIEVGVQRYVDWYLDYY